MAELAIAHLLLNRASATLSLPPHALRRAHALLNHAQALTQIQTNSLHPPPPPPPSHDDTHLLQSSPGSSSSAHTLALASLEPLTVELLNFADEPADVVLRLPRRLLDGWPPRVIIRVTRERVAGARPTLVQRSTSIAQLEAEEIEAPAEAHECASWRSSNDPTDRPAESVCTDLYSIDELVCGQLGARAPPLGSLVLTFHAAGTSLDGEPPASTEVSAVQRAHAMGSLLRLACYPAEMSSGNDLARLLNAMAACQDTPHLLALVESLRDSWLAGSDAVLRAAAHAARPASPLQIEQFMRGALRKRPGEPAAPLAPGVSGYPDEDVKDLFQRVAARSDDGEIVFVTSEVAPWCTVGGLGVMVDHLTRALAEHGSSVMVIAPAYDTCAEALRDAAPCCRLVVPLGDATDTLSVLVVQRPGVCFYFLRSKHHFRAPYAHAQDGLRLRLTPAVLLSRGALFLMASLGIRPAVVISNDWVGALTAPYARHVAWAAGYETCEPSWTKRTVFVHLVHNLEMGYDGAFDLSHSAPPLAGLHQLPAHLLMEGGSRINLTRAALLCCHAWATVSSGYREQLLRSSTLSPILRSFRHPFACASGLPLRSIRAELAARGLDGSAGRRAARARLQRRCFGAEAPASMIVAFIGRVTQQKGVHLLLECAPALFRATAGRVQLLICGRAETSDPYAARCERLMKALRADFPHNFWASQPNRYFEEGLLVSAASDFGVMPSLFEPSGLVGEEFLAAGTPLICSNTGGMRDRVVPYCEETRTGNGVLFTNNLHHALLQSLERVLQLFSSEGGHYEALRANAAASACDVSETAAHWKAEMCRLRACLAAARHSEHHDRLC